MDTFTQSPAMFFFQLAITQTAVKIFTNKSSNPQTIFFSNYDQFMGQIIISKSHNSRDI